MNMNMLAQLKQTEQSISEMSSLDCALFLLEKEKSKQSLTFVEQCVMIVLMGSVSPDSATKLTRDFYNKLMQGESIEMHPTVDKFISLLPSAWQMHLSEAGAIWCGLNADGSEKEVSNKEEAIKSICNTYIVRKAGTNEVKIGKSTNPTQRIRTLSMQSGATLETLCIIPKNIEHKLHKQFCNLRTIGEWFDDRNGEIAVLAKHFGGDQ